MKLTSSHIFFFISELNTTSSPVEASGTKNEEDILYQKDAVFDVEISLSNYTESNISLQNNVSEGTTQGPRLDQKLTEISGAPQATEPLSTERPCPLDCGPGGGCIIKDINESPSCLCPLGRGGERCEKGSAVIISSVFLY